MAQKQTNKKCINILLCNFNTIVAKTKTYLFFILYPVMGVAQKPGIIFNIVIIIIVVVIMLISLQSIISQKQTIYMINLV